MEDRMKRRRLRNAGHELTPLEPEEKRRIEREVDETVERMAEHEVMHPLGAPFKFNLPVDVAIMVHSDDGEATVHFQWHRGTFYRNLVEEDSPLGCALVRARIARTIVIVVVYPGSSTPAEVAASLYRDQEMSALFYAPLDGDFDRIGRMQFVTKHVIADPLTAQALVMALKRAGDGFGVMIESWS